MKTMKKIKVAALSTLAALAISAPVLAGEDFSYDFPGSVLDIYIEAATVHDSCVAMGFTYGYGHDITLRKFYGSDGITYQIKDQTTGQIVSKTSSWNQQTQTYEDIPIVGSYTCVKVGGF